MPESPTDAAQPTCLVLLPEAGKSTWVVGALDRAIQMTSMRTAYLDSEGEYGGLISDIAAQIPRTIESADAVIVDITGSDPNIMYQLGFAHALKKPVLPILEKYSGNIPSNLRGYLFLVYDPDGLNRTEFESAVRRWISRFSGGR